VVQLTTSFRALRPIQHLVNAAFQPEMQDDVASGPAAYSPLYEETPAISQQPSIVALPAPRPYGSMRISRQAIDACLPETIVAFIEWLVRARGWKVPAPQKPSEPLA